MIKLDRTLRVSVFLSTNMSASTDQPLLLACACINLNGLDWLMNLFIIKNGLSLFDLTHFNFYITPYLFFFYLIEDTTSDEISDEASLEIPSKRTRLGKKYLEELWRSLKELRIKTFTMCNFVYFKLSYWLYDKLFLDVLLCTLSISLSFLKEVIFDLGTPGSNIMK